MLYDLELCTAVSLPITEQIIHKQPQVFRAVNTIRVDNPLQLNDPTLKILYKGQTLLKSVRQTLILFEVLLHFRPHNKLQVFIR